MSDELQPFPWYGGKANHLDFILPRLPDQPIYVEPFGGSGAMLFSREPAAVETFNDLDRDVVTFFRVLRERPDELLPQLEATPYSREEYRVAIAAAGNDNIPDLERARLFYVRAAQMYSGLAQYATEGRWSYSIGSSCRGMSNAVSAWWSNVDGLDAIVDRLKRVQLECKPATDVIERYDHEDALIYCDPPYPMEARGEAGRGYNDPVAYGNELDAEDHRELAEVLSVQCSRTQRGELRSIKVKVEYYEVQVDQTQDGATHRNGENIRIRFEPSGRGYAALEGWKDASDHSGWVLPRVLRCLRAAEDAVTNVPDIEAVEDSAELFDLHLEAGEEAWQNVKEEL